MDAVIYTRVSLDRTGEGLAVARQEDECRQLAERLGFNVNRVYSDNDISATSGKRRPEFEAMLQDRPERILCWHTDRLLRSFNDLQPVLDSGATVHCVASTDLDLATPGGIAMARTLTAWASYETDQKAARQKAAARQRAQQGKPWWSHRPFGFEMNGDHRPDEAEALRAAYANVLQGTSLYEVARQWNAAGFVRESGKEWVSRRVRQTLLAPRNAGIRVYRKVEVGSAEWGPIVSEATFRAVVEILRDPNRYTGQRPRGAGDISGELSALKVVQCAKCIELGITPGTLMLSSKNRLKVKYNGSGQAYQCANQHIAYPVDWLNGVVMTELVATLPQVPHLWPVAVEDGNPQRRNELEAERVTLEARSADLGRAFAAGAIDFDALQAGGSAIQERLRAIQREFAELAGTGETWTVLEAVQDEEYVWQELSAMEKGQYRKLLGRVFSSITVAPRGRGNRGLTKHRHLIEFTVREV